MIDIKWLKGNSKDKYVIELMFKDNTKGYIKGTYEYVCNQYDIQWTDGNEVVGQVIYDPEWKVICHRYRAKEAA